MAPAAALAAVVRATDCSELIYPPTFIAAGEGRARRVLGWAGPWLALENTPTLGKAAASFECKSSWNLMTWATVRSLSYCWPSQRGTRLGRQRHLRLTGKTGPSGAGTARLMPEQLPTSRATGALAERRIARS